MKNELARKILDETPPEIKESVMIAALKQYLAETPREQIDADWKKVKDLNYNGPTIEEFMRNNLFEEPEQRIRKFTDDQERIETIINEAYQLYMPQVRSEITDLTRFLLSHWQGNKITSPNILEIGTKFGGTFYIWNKLIEMIGSGLAISIDLDDKGLHGGIGDERMDTRDLWFQERFPNCHFIRGDSHSNETWNRLGSFTQMNPPGGTLESPGQLYKPFLDFLFIDGDHSYSGVEQDFKDYSRFVKPGGVIAMHDIQISEHHHSRNVYVGEFWNHLKEICPWEMIEIIGDKDQIWAGIGILIKK